MDIGIVEEKRMGLNRSLIGKQYPPQDYGVTAEAMMRYARAYNEDNPRFFDSTRPGGIIAPPMFGVVMGWLPITTPNIGGAMMPPGESLVLEVCCTNQRGELVQ